MSYLPKDHNHVSPYLVVDDANEMIDFLVNTFDGQLLIKIENDDGQIMHSEVKIFDSVIMIGEGGDQYPSTTAIYHIYVPDCDVYMKKAVEYGGLISRDPETFPDGNRRGSILGPMSNTWTITTKLN